MRAHSVLRYITIITLMSAATGLFILVTAGCDDADRQTAPPETTEAQTARVITVNDAQFSEIYPAVWFSPSTGEITGITPSRDKPPKEHFECWIEPKDPEFAFSASSGQGIGFAFIGFGDTVFEIDRHGSLGKFNPRLHALLGPMVANGELSRRPVFYCRGMHGDCLIEVIAFDRDRQLIQFKWKQIR